MFSLSHQSEKQKIYTTTIIGSIANFLLVLLKFVAGFIGNSAAMIADAVHSLSDFVTDVIVIVFVRFAHKPKDELYAYGYGKYETLATAIIGVLLFIVGSGILWDGGWKIYHYFADDTLPEPHIIAFYMALVSIAVKELLYRYTAAVGRAVKSQVVVANAWHHRSDAMSSIGTAVGIGGAIFFGDGFEILDPVAAIVVSFFIMKVASTIDSVTSLAPVSKTKCNGNPLIWHFTLHTPDSLTNGISVTILFVTFPSLRTPMVCCPDLFFSDLYLLSSALNPSVFLMKSISSSRSMCANRLYPSSNAFSRHFKAFSLSCILE